jgi:hypothetical protein
MIPKSTTLGPVMHETNRIPVMHSWCKQVLGWWNRIVARPDNDIVKLTLRDNINMATSNMLPRRPPSSKCWAAALLACLKAIDPALEDNIVGMQHIAITKVMNSLHTNWQRFLWGDMHTIPAKEQRITVRDITDSKGFKKRTYQYWFSDSVIAKGDGFVYHLNSEKQIRYMAMFRLGSHNLAINRQRYTDATGLRVQRSERVCQCCEQSAVEDELHIFECSAFNDLRDNFHDIISHVPDQDLDAYMLSTNNRGNNAYQWRRLAEYIFKYFQQRDELMSHVDVT